MTPKFLTYFLFVAVLFTSCSKDDEASNDMGDAPVEATILTHTDVEFSLDDSARYFASSTGKLYLETELNTEAAAIIDVVGDSNQAFIAFSSPSSTSQIPDGTITKVQHVDVSITTEQFDAIEDDSLLSTISVIDDNESVGISGYQDKIIVFENAAGKKGAIKLKAINATRLLVDIKVIK